MLRERTPSDGVLEPTNGRFDIRSSGASVVPGSMQLVIEVRVMSASRAQVIASGAAVIADALVTLPIALIGGSAVRA